MNKTRQNISISVDERGLAGEKEVITLSSTGTDIVKMTTASQTVGVHPDDLQEALDQVRQFIKDRPQQSKQVLIQKITDEKGKESELQTELELGN